MGQDAQMGLASLAVIASQVVMGTVLLCVEHDCPPLSLCLRIGARSSYGTGSVLCWSPTTFLRSLRLTMTVRPSV